MDFVKTKQDNGIFTIALNRPDVRNAFHPEMIEALKSAFLEADSSSCRVVYLFGEGKSFCAGADLQWMKSMKDFSLEENLTDSKNLFAMFEAAQECSLPIVCKAHGHVMGGASGLLAVSDIVVAGKSTQFAFSEVKLGLAPAVISPFVLRKMKVSLAREWMLTGQMFSAEEAKESGLVHHVADEAVLEDLASKKVSQFLKLGPQAVRETKRLTLKVSNPMLDGLGEQTAKVIAALRVGDEGQEGLTAFFEKRDPSWKKDVQ